MNILLIGGSGADGRTICNLEVTKKMKITIASRKLKKWIIEASKKRNISHEALDVRNKSELVKIINKENYDLILYMAGVAISSSTVERDNLKENYDTIHWPVLNIIEELRKKGSKTKFINFGSTEMYGNTYNRIDESCLPAPVNSYGFAKTSAYYDVKYYRERYDVNCYTAIFSNHESKYSCGERFYDKLITYLRSTENKYFNFYNKDYYRDWSDAEELLTDLIKFEISEDLIFSSGRSAQIEDVVTYVKKMKKNKSEIVWQRSNDNEVFFDIRGAKEISNMKLQKLTGRVSYKNIYDLILTSEDDK